jgi:hypothetical protein
MADSYGVSGRPERSLLRQPDFSDLLECRLGSDDLGLLLALGLYHRVLFGANERAGLFVQRTGVGQTDVRKPPDRQQPFLTRRSETTGCEIAAPLGLDDLFDLVLRPTPRFREDKRMIYEDRIRSKSWLKSWPLLKRIEA